MANTLTGLIPTIYEGLDVVSRELTGLVPSVSFFPGAERIAKDQTVTFPVVPAYSAADITPAATGPDPSASTIGNDTLTINKSRGVTFYWEGDEQLGLKDGFSPVFRDQVAQGMRTLVNEMETDLAALYAKFSRATGTAGTTPFASTLADTAALRKILSDNGAPLNDLQLVLNTTAGEALRNLTQLNKANEAGGDVLLRRGILMDVHGFAIRESAQVKTHTKGTAASATTNTAGYAIGATVITLASAGTGTIVAGDCLTFAGDSNIYSVVSGDTDVSNGGTITLAEPGLRQALAASAIAITLKANHAANMAFSKSAMHLVTRVPAMPQGGDSADDVVIVQDPVSGLAFQVALYRQFKRVAFEVGAAWGVKCTKPAHTAVLLG